VKKLMDELSQRNLRRRKNDIRTFRRLEKPHRSKGGLHRGEREVRGSRGPLMNLAAQKRGQERNPGSERGGGEGVRRRDGGG